MKQAIHWGSSDRGALAKAAAVGVAYCLAAYLSIVCTKSGIGIAMIWPPSGILYATIVLVGPRFLAPYIVAAGLASLVANHEAGMGLRFTLTFTASNMIEPLVAAAILDWRRRERSVCFVHLTGLRRFLLSSIVACAVSAAVAATAVDAGASARFAVSWFSTDLLGILIVAPNLLIAAKGGQQLRRRLLAITWSERILWVVAMTAIATLTFGQSRYPLLFLPMMAVLAAVFRFGATGGTASILIIAFASSIGMAHQTGPAFLIIADQGTRVLLLQVYLLSLMGVALLTAAFLEGRDKLMLELAERNRLLVMAEHVASVGHWRLSFEDHTVIWSPQVFRIHDIPPTDRLSFQTDLDSYHPEDRDRVAATFEAAITNHGNFSFAARILRSDGSIRHVLCRGEVEMDPSGKPVALFGVLKDVTSQVETESALRAAQLAAEKAARDALVMADTDQLTGIANRRKALHVLDEHIAEARRTKADLSLAILDIDHFKSFNDRFGHAIGDAVLKRVAKDAEHVLRGSDLLGRLGGEEFVLLLPAASAPTAMSVVETVRRAIEAGRSGDADLSVTASFGVATLAEGETAAMLLQRADTALYRAKRAGRNLACLAATPSRKDTGGFDGGASAVRPHDAVAFPLR